MSEDVLSERDHIDRAIEGRTLCHLLAANADEHPTEPALSWEEGQGWKTMDWRQYREAVAAATLGLRSIGVGRGDFVAIMTRNRPEHVIGDLAAVHAGATPVSFYNTLAPEQIAYIAGHCEAKVAVVEGREFMQRWEKVKADLPALERTVLLEDSEEFAEYDWALSWDGVLASGREALAAPGGREAFDAMWQKVKPGDLATLVYTSGTTGPPKGVMVTQRNVLWTCCSLDRTGSYTTGLRAISYLPLAHALERLATHYLSMYKAAHVYFCPEVMQVFEYVPEVRPQVFAGVPRLFEKLQAGIVAALSAEPDERKRKIALRAIETGKRAVRLEQGGKRVPIGLR